MNSPIYFNIAQNKSSNFKIEQYLSLVVDQGIFKHNMGSSNQEEKADLSSELKWSKNKIMNWLSDYKYDLESKTVLNLTTKNFEIHQKENVKNENFMNLKKFLEKLIKGEPYNDTDLELSKDEFELLILILKQKQFITSQQCQNFPLNAKGITHILSILLKRSKEEILRTIMNSIQKILMSRYKSLHYAIWSKKKVPISFRLERDQNIYQGFYLYYFGNDVRKKSLQEIYFPNKKKGSLKSTNRSFTNSLLLKYFKSEIFKIHFMKILCNDSNLKNGYSVQNNLECKSLKILDHLFQQENINNKNYIFEKIQSKKLKLPLFRIEIEYFRSKTLFIINKILDSINL